MPFAVALGWVHWRAEILESSGGIYLYDNGACNGNFRTECHSLPHWEGACCLMLHMLLFASGFRCLPGCIGSVCVRLAVCLTADDETTQFLRSQALYIGVVWFPSTRSQAPLEPVLIVLFVVLSHTEGPPHGRQC